MDIKKLYSDVCILACEIPLFTFLLYCDTFARMLISTYGKEYAVGEGEYIPPESIGDSYSVDGAFYGAARTFVAGKVLGDAQMVDESKKEAQKVYLSLWKQRNKGKRIKGAKW